MRALGAFWIFAGIMHFVIPKQYEETIPDWLPAHEELVVWSGVGEIAGGLGVLVPQTRKVAGWGLVALLLAVFPANINMAVNHEDYPVPQAALLARLPFQFVFIAWALWASGARR